MMNKEFILSLEQLRQVQLIQLEMLVEVDKICKKNNIHYNIIAGTLLGAVRHGGYVPWDDDADVAMLRTEYEKFRTACKTDLDKSRFYFQDHRNTKGYRWGYGKLRRRDTLFLRKDQEHMPYEQGIFIDIFPLDGVPEHYFMRCLHCMECFVIRKALWSEVGKRTDKGSIKGLLYQILSTIDVNKIFKYYHRLILRSNSAESKLVRILLFPTPNREWGYYRKWYQDSEKILFEGYEFSGIKEYDEYLKFKFKDYMKLPDMEHRTGHPVSKLKLLGE